jgi:hypothetical protein
MTAYGDGTPQDPVNVPGQTGEQNPPATEAQTSETNGLKNRAQDKAAQAKEAVTGKAGDAVQATRDKVGQAKDKVGQAKEKVGQAKEKVGQAKEKVGQATGKVADGSSHEDGAAAVTSPPAVRGAGIGAAALGVATALVVWLLRRRARRNAGPWQVAARTTKSQIRTVRKQAKAGVKAARKRSREEASAQVAAAKARAAKAKAKARDRAKTWR